MRMASWPTRSSRSKKARRPRLCPFPFSRHSGTGWRRSLPYTVLLSATLSSAGDRRTRSQGTEGAVKHGGTPASASSHSMTPFSRELYTPFLSSRHPRSNEYLCRMGTCTNIGVNRLEIGLYCAEPAPTALHNQLQLPEKSGSCPKSGDGEHVCLLAWCVGHLGATRLVCSDCWT